MTRNAGSVVDVEARTVRERDRVVYPLERLQISPAGIYHGRPVEGGPFRYKERWLLPAKGWCVNRFSDHVGRVPEWHWYIEPEIIEVSGDRWTIRDAFIDFYVFEGLRYELEDIDEFAQGIAEGELPPHEALAILHATNSLITSLRDNGFSGAALLRDFAPGLPA